LPWRASPWRGHANVADRACRPSRAASNLTEPRFGGAFAWPRIAQRSVADPLTPAQAVFIAKHRGPACLQPEGRRRSEHRHPALTNGMSAAWSDIEGAATHRLHDPVDELAKTFRMACERERKRQGSRYECLGNQPYPIHPLSPLARVRFTRAMFFRSRTRN
jgi:hypothetical protein